jgi:hypothetical protein
VAGKRREASQNIDRVEYGVVAQTY